MRSSLHRFTPADLQARLEDARLCHCRSVDRNCSTTFTKAWIPSSSALIMIVMTYSWIVTKTNTKTELSSCLYISLFCVFSKLISLIPVSFFVFILGRKYIAFVDVSPPTVKVLTGECMGEEGNVTRMNGMIETRQAYRDGGRGGRRESRKITSLHNQRSDGVSGLGGGRWEERKFRGENG